MSQLSLAVASIIVVMYVCGVVAVKITYGFPWLSAIGLRRVAIKNNVVTYVSRGPLRPTAVFWLGSKDWQTSVVASAIANGELPRKDYTNLDDDIIHTKAIRLCVNVWPDGLTKSLFGKEEDLSYRS